MKRIFLILIFILGIFLKVFAQESEEEILLKKVFKNGNFTEIDGTKIYYLKKGEQKEVIILIHGFAASSFCFRKNLNELSKKFTVYALDLKGFGLSDKPKDSEYSIDDYANLVLKFMDKFSVKKAILAGNSMGGAVSLKIALNSPDRVKKLILIDSAGLERSPTSANLMKVLDNPSLKETVEKFIGDDFIIKAIMKAVFYDLKIDEEIFFGYVYPLRTEGAVEAILKLVQNFKSLYLGEVIKEIKIPTLIIWGEKDKVVPLQNAYNFNKLISNSKLVIYPKCGHVPMEEVPEKFNETVLNFISP